MNIDNMDQVIPLLSKRIDKFTSKESTSVPYSVARQIMDSTLYCIELAENDSRDNSVLRSPNSEFHVEDSFFHGLSLVKERVAQSRQLFHTIEATFNSYHNSCYYETIIEGMPAFFLHYNAEFDAKNIILTLDYPLLHEITHLEGIDKIQEYLRRTQLEQQFLAGFPTETIEAILCSYGTIYDTEYTSLIFNCCSIVLNNAIGCIILDKPISTLHITEKECDKLKQIGEAHTNNQLYQLLIQALQNLISTHFEHNTVLYEYFSHHMNRLAIDYKSYCEHNCLHHIFLNLPPTQSIQPPIFEDGLSMQDEELRLLIDEMQELQCLADRITLLKEKVGSLTDLTEVLTACFFSGEYEEIFQLLSEEECSVLKEEITLKIQFDEDLYDWESALIEYQRKG